MVVNDGEGASAASRTQSLTASSQRRRRREMIWRRDGRTSASPSSSPDPRSSKRNRPLRHAKELAVSLEWALIRDQRPAPQEVGRLAAMRAWGGRAATVGPVEEGKRRRPCLASAHAACPSPCSQEDGAGPGTSTGDDPEGD